MSMQLLYQIEHDQDYIESFGELLILSGNLKLLTYRRRQEATWMEFIKLTVN